MTILKYAILKNTNTSELYRVLEVYPKNNEVVLIQLETENINIISMAVEKINKDFVSDNTPVSRNRDLDTMSQAEHQLFLKRCEMIDFIEKNFSDEELFSDSSRRKIRKKVIELGIVGKTSFYVYLRMYLQAGRSKLALVPQYSGNASTERTYTVKPGMRKGSTKLNDGKFHSPDKNEGVVLNEYHTTNIKKALMKYYFSGVSKKLVQTYQDMKVDFYRDKPKDEIPTYNQVKYVKDQMKESGFDKLTVKRVGQKKFNLTKRALLNDTFATGDLPGATFEIDASIPNIQLLDETRTNVIGTPIFYLVIDTFTKMVVGMHVGLDHPSWNVASSALFNCSENKVDYCKRFDIDIKPSQWVQTALPRAILADKGEFAGSMPEDIVNYLKVEIRNTPSGRPDLKPNVERYFRMFEDKLNGYIPGFKLTPKGRGDRDPQIDAMLTLKEATQILIETALFFNNHTFKGYKATDDMLYNRVPLVPNKLWEWSTVNIGTDSFSCDENVLKFALMKKANASVTERGVKFKNMYFTNPELEADCWFSKARENGRKKIEIKFDDRNLDSIYIFNDNLEITTLYQTEASARIFGHKSYTEVLHMEDYRKTIIEDSVDEENSNELRFIQNIKGIVKNAEKQGRAEGGKLRPNTSEKRENRKVEADRIRKGQALNSDETYDYEVVVTEEKEQSLAERKRQHMYEKVYGGGLK